MISMPYESIRDDIRCGDAFEFAPSSLLGYVIRFFSKKPVSHTALCLSIDEYSNYAGNRKFFLEANPEGISLEPISQDIRGFKGKIFYRKLQAVCDLQRRIIADWALQQSGKPYAYVNLFQNILGHVSADSSRMFCSEFRFIALVVAGVIPHLVYNKDDNKVYDSRTGKVVPAPRPGEFDQYGVDYPAVEVLI